MTVCIFCGQDRKRNKEHIFPEWLQIYLGVQKLELEIHTGLPLVLKRRYVYQSHVGGSVCGNCNTGWMSQLESRVKPIIISLIEDDTHRKISIDDSSTVAWWIFKTALTLHSSSPYEKVIPQKHYRLVFNQRAPQHVMITIGQLKTKLTGPSWIQSQNWIGADKYLSDDKLLAELKQTYRITFGFANLALQVLYFPITMPLFLYEGGMQCIHPLSKMLVWPPQERMTDLWEVDKSVVITSPL